MTADIDEDEAYVERSRAPLLEHLRELRGRLFFCVGAVLAGFIVAFAFSRQLLDLLLVPWDTAAGLMEMQTRSGDPHGFSLDTLRGVLGLIDLPEPRREFVVQPIAIAPLETFITKVKMSAFGGIVLAFPVIAWQLYRFVAPGLYKKERMAFLPFLAASPVLFLMGAALVYFILLPFIGVVSLSGGMLGEHQIATTPSVEKSLGLTIKLILGFGICFQLPVVLSLLGMAGIVGSKGLAAFRRFAVLLVFVLAAIFTPPDPISMLCLAVPLVLLYEISIWIVKVIEIRRPKEADDPSI